MHLRAFVHSTFYLDNKEDWSAALCGYHVATDCRVVSKNRHEVSSTQHNKNVFFYIVKM